MRKSGRAPPVLTAFRWLPPQGNGQAHMGTSVAPTPGDLAPTALPLALSHGLRPPTPSVPAPSLFPPLWVLGPGVPFIQTLPSSPTPGLSAQTAPRGEAFPRAAR